ncbi:MAG: hypothetical protein HYR84_03785 [Planctomycetes bacterium]|nr:hypothetical protein [Planctomycetota bacterium]
MDEFWVGMSEECHKSRRFLFDAEAPPATDTSISIFLKPGQAIEGKTFEIRKDTPPTQRMPIHVRALAPGQKVPMVKAFVQDYAMKLEFDTAKDGVIAGRIYVCLPDDGKSVVAGTFTLKR